MTLMAVVKEPCHIKRAKCILQEGDIDNIEMRKFVYRRESREFDIPELRVINHRYWVRNVRVMIRRYFPAPTATARQTGQYQQDKFIA